MIVAYYITGHGFGHATRSIEVARGLLKAGHSVSIVTNLPSTFFEDLRHPVDEDDGGGEELRGCLQVHRRMIDTGAIQPDALRVDPKLTLDEYMNNIYDKHDSIIAAEVEFLKLIGADLVLADATPSACAAGRLAGVDAVALLSNFGWDYVYAYMARTLGPDAETRYAAMIKQVAEDYALASVIYSYPGEIPWAEAQPHLPVHRIPLVSRRARRGRGEVRESLGIPLGARLLLLGFGGHSASWRLQDSFLPAGWHCCVLGMPPDELPGTARFHALPHDTYVPDVVAASDCWLGKLGYGTISEAISHSTPLIHVSRSCWPEERYVEEYLERCNGGVKMPVEDFLSGNWSSHLDAAVRSKDSGAIQPCGPIFEHATGEVVRALEMLTNIRRI
jgi:L-arabinokinase